jgi:hypothetical protein
MTKYYVYDLSTGFAVVGAEVVQKSYCSGSLTFSTGPNQITSGVTDSSGEVTLQTGCALGGSFSYTVTAKGYETFSGSGSQGSFSVSSVTVELTPAGYNPPTQPTNPLGSIQNAFSGFTSWLQSAGLYAAIALVAIAIIALVAMGTFSKTDVEGIFNAGKNTLNKLKSKVKGDKKK